LSNNKKKDHKDHKHPSPAVKVGEGVRENPPSDKEKAEGHDKWLRLGAEFEN
jgi:hypothetical protein